MQRFVLLLLLAGPASIHAQSLSLIDFNQHGWYSYSGDHGVAGRWGVHFDAQWRRSKVITAWQQYQLRPGLNYEHNPNLLLTLGYVYTRSYPYGDFPATEASPEHRIYQQALLRHPGRKVSLQQRLRLEQRFIRYPDGDAFTYQNRFRYLLKAEFNLNEQWYIPVYDEIVLGVPPNIGARVFDQNRLFAGIGYKFGKVGNLEAGYLKQFLGQRNGRIWEFNNTLFLSFSSQLRLRD